MSLLGNLFNNIKNNKMVSDSMESLKQNRLVYSGMEICNIAKEVFDSVQKEETQQKNLEQHYSESVNKVTQIPREEIENRIDYKVVSFTASSGRRVQKITKKGFEKAYLEYQELQKKIVAFFEFLRNKCRKLVNFAQ